MIDYTPPPAIARCVNDASNKYGVSVETIMRSIIATQQIPQRFSIGIMGIPVAYEAIFPSYGIDNYMVENDTCTNIMAGALAIAFDQRAQGVQNKMEDWQNYTVSGSMMERAGKFASLMKAAAVSYSVPLALLEAVATQESGFQPNAMSPKGAIGLMQLMPDTARSLGVNPYDVADNIKGGAYLLSSLLVKYSGNLSLALAAYNAGSDNVAKYNGIPPFAETQAYVPSVESLYQKYSSR